MYDIDRIHDYVYKEFNIRLNAYKSVQMNRRIENFISKLEFDTSNDFIRECKINKRLREDFLDLITINVTQFFRNSDIFFRLEELFKKYLPKRDVYRVWSSACSNGSEPYSVAMILENINIPNYEILATDIDRKMLNYAEDAIYTTYDLRNVPSEYMDKYFDFFNDKFIVKNFIRNKIEFMRHDLILDYFPTCFDLILCRNVVIYFTKDEKMKIYNKFYDSLNNYGVVFIGATENIYDYKQIGFNKLGTFFYQKVVQ